MRLNTVLGALIGQTQGSLEEVRAAYEAAADAAQAIGFADHEADTLQGLWVGSFGRGDYPAALDAALKLREVAERLREPSALLFADRIQAQTRHMMGQHRDAKELAVRVLSDKTPYQRIGNSPMVPFDRRVSMGIVLARISWLEGCPVQAARQAETALAVAEDDMAYALCHVLAFACCPISLWNGDYDAAERFIQRLETHARQHSLKHWAAWARTLAAFRAGAKHFDVTPEDHMLWETLGTLLPSTVTDQTLHRVSTGKAGWCAAEILRAHAANLLSRAPDDQGVNRTARELLGQSLSLARAQHALAWELRGVTTLASLTVREAGPAAAINELDSVLNRLGADVDTPDLRRARELRAELSAQA